MNDPTALLARAVCGDRTALRAVVDAWIPQIRRWALVACGEPVAAEDAVQESLVRLIRSIHTFDPARPFAPWLKVLVFNAARKDRARGRRAELHEQAITGQEPAAEPAPGRGMDLARASQRVREAFAHLSPRQREILVLVDLQGETPAEVAVSLGLTPGAVRGQLFQARRAVRSVLSESDLEAILPLLREA